MAFCILVPVGTTETPGGVVSAVPAGTETALVSQQTQR
jgi:hypothetical protein